jgi:hypothetical protein
MRGPLAIDPETNKTVEIPQHIAVHAARKRLDAARPILEIQGQIGFLKRKLDRMTK